MVRVLGHADGFSVAQPSDDATEIRIADALGTTVYFLDVAPGEHELLLGTAPTGCRARPGIGWGSGEDGRYRVHTEADFVTHAATVDCPSPT